MVAKPKSPRNKKAYEKPRAGAWVTPRMRGYKMACCDCGLVHTMQFGVFVAGKNSEPGTFKIEPVRDKKYQVRFRVWRDNRATGQMRRAMGRHTKEMK